MLSSEYGYYTLLSFVPYFNAQKMKKLENLKTQLASKGGNTAISMKIQELFESYLSPQVYSSNEYSK